MSTRRPRQSTIVWWIIVVVGVVLSVNLIKSAIDFLGLKDRLTDQELRVEKLQQERQELEREYSYKTSGYYLETEIRDRLNMAKPGETVIVVPIDEVLGASIEAKPIEKRKEDVNLPIWRKWWELFF